MEQVDKAQLVIAEEVARFGSFTWDIESDAVTWSPGMHRLLELPRSTPASINLFLSFVPEPYRSDVVLDARKAVEQRRAFLHEYPMNVLEDLQIWVRAKGRPVVYNGRATVIGVVMDITQQKRDEAKLADLNAQLTNTVKELSDTVTLLNLERQFRDHE